MNSLLNINSGADYQMQLGVKGQSQRSVNAPRMEATYGKIRPTKGWTETRSLYMRENTHADELVGYGRSE